MRIIVCSINYLIRTFFQAAKRIGAVREQCGPQKACPYQQRRRESSTLCDPRCRWALPPPSTRGRFHRARPLSRPLPPQMLTKNSMLLRTETSNEATPLLAFLKPDDLCPLKALSTKLSTEPKSICTILNRFHYT